MEDLRYCPNCRTELIDFCPTHPLNYGMVKIMNISAMYGRGLSWANIIEQEEQIKLDSMTKEEKLALEIKKIKEEKDNENGIKEYMMKKKEIFTDSSGLSKMKFNKPCKHQYMHGKFCSKNEGPTMDCAEELNCGCWPHKQLKGMCSFIHDDEKEEMKELFNKHNIQEGNYLILERIIDNKPIYSARIGKRW